jgi:glycosyltransferase involved in cell wall biosynthesis
MESRKQIIYIKPADSSFILTDQRLLEKHFNLVPFLVRQSSDKWLYFKDLLSLSIFLLKQSVKSVAFVCWFGDYHTAVMVLIAKLTGKITIVFAGGQEAICYTELGKGVYRKKIRGWCVKYALRNAALILPNHSSLIYHENYFYNDQNPHIDGIRHYVKGLKGNMIVVPNGIDSSRIDRNPVIHKDPNLVLTVGTMNMTADFYNKGFDLFVELARLNPAKKFVLIGVKKTYLGWIESKFKVSEILNLTIIPSYCPDEVLKDYYNKAKVYLQVSITEGMPISLGEAMLCECIPVGSNVNGIPDAIGKTGVLVYKREISELNHALQKAFEMNTGIEARVRILEHFTMEKRENAMVAAINSAIN